MGKINLLDKEVSNKIAAGEVVERPASVVKELVENSIDAGATKITVEIKNGGIGYIRVTDNGGGMSMEDARMAFLRHATSKIHSAADLDAIDTLGFRGEALSSIAAVSRMDLYTKTADEPGGVHIQIDAGELVKAEEAGVPEGTAFVVQDLFYNTPARMKFLKKNFTEAGYIADCMVRFILAHPEISFRFINGGKEQFFSPGNQRLADAVYTVYGKDYARAVLPVSYENEGVRVEGMVGKRETSRPNRNYQSYFVNKRYIKSPLIIRAVEEAFKNQIMVGKFPMAVLNLTVNPALVDINVHPTKLEVKFSSEKLIYETVYFGVKNALYQLEREGNQAVPGAGSVQYTPKKPVFDGLTLDSSLKKELRADGGKKQNPFHTPARQAKQERLSAFSKGDESKAIKEAPKWKLCGRTYQKKQSHTEKMPREKLEHDVLPSTYEPGSHEYFEALQEEAKKQSLQPGSQVKVEQERSGDYSLSGRPAPSAHEEEAGEAPFRIVGQVWNTYIIAQRGSEMLLVDQHAAHERLKYETLKEEMDGLESMSQSLLIPVVVDLSASEYACYVENREFLKGIGFEIDPFGEFSVVIRMTPEDLPEEDLKALLIELLTQLADSRQEIISQKRERAMYTVACKAAVKANHAMHPEEMQRLLEDVLALETIDTCPHGRPITVRVTKTEMEKWFKRIV
jgi:DNA mismatch repair protein MutL